MNGSTYSNQLSFAYKCILLHTGVAVAAAFCALESLAVESREWTFGVIVTGTSNYH